MPSARAAAGTARAAATPAARMASRALLLIHRLRTRPENSRARAISRRFRKALWDPLDPAVLDVGPDVGLAQGRPGRVAAVGPQRVHHAAAGGEAVVVADEGPRGEEALVRVPALRADVRVGPLAPVYVGQALEGLDADVVGRVAIVEPDGV